MKKNSKYIILFALCLTIMSGCNSKKAKTEPTQTPTQEVTQQPEENTQEPEATDSEQTTDKPTETQGPVSTEEAKNTDNANTNNTNATKKPENENSNTTSDSSKKELPIYTINDTTLETESAIAMVPADSKLTPELVVNAVVDNFKEHNLQVGIDFVKEKEDAVIVSFKSDKAPLTDVGAGVEATILDCISQTLLDTFDTCKKVIFQVEGKAYESGHLLYEIDEAYNWK